MIALIAAVFPFPHGLNRWATRDRVSLIKAIQQGIDRIQVRDRAWAQRVCRTIPQACPFERTIQIFGRTLFHIPPLCQLNPFYEQLMGLRFRALCYLADVGEDIAQYSR